MCNFLHSQTAREEPEVFTWQDFLGLAKPAASIPPSLIPRRRRSPTARNHLVHKPFEGRPDANGNGEPVY